MPTPVFSAIRGRAWAGFCGCGGWGSPQSGQVILSRKVSGCTFSVSTYHVAYQQLRTSGLGNLPAPTKIATPHVRYRIWDTTSGSCVCCTVRNSGFLTFQFYRCFSTSCFLFLLFFSHTFLRLLVSESRWSVPIARSRVRAGWSAQREPADRVGRRECQRLVQGWRPTLRRPGHSTCLA